MMATLTALRDALGAVSGVATSRVGMESNMTPADYPMVRIVPSRVNYAPTIGRRRCDCLVYFGQPIHEFDNGLEALYASLFTLEKALLGAAQAAPNMVVEYVETILDEDRLDAYKLMCLRLVVEG